MRQCNVNIGITAVGVEWSLWLWLWWRCRTDGRVGLLVWVNNLPSAIVTPIIVAATVATATAAAAATVAATVKWRNIILRRHHLLHLPDVK